jgi:hypothetical protein
MISVIENRLADIALLCRSHKVAKMYLFGSAATGKAIPNDIDFLVTFGEVPLYNYFDNYIDLKDSLESLLEKPVDLVEEKTLSNPYLIASINRTKLPVYG